MWTQNYFASVFLKPCNHGRLPPRSRLGEHLEVWWCGVVRQREMYQGRLAWRDSRSFDGLTLVCRGSAETGWAKVNVAGGAPTASSAERLRCPL
jgi:hypothetical protein